MARAVETDLGTNQEDVVKGAEAKRRWIARCARCGRRTLRRSGAFERLCGRCVASYRALDQATEAEMWARNRLYDRSGKVEVLRGRIGSRPQ